MSRGKVIVGVGLFSLVLLGVLAALAQTAEKPPTELYVRTTPPGAKVFVDGKELGTSPSLVEVEPGEHTIRVTLEGHEPQTTKATIAEGRIKRVILGLHKGPGARDGQPKPGEAEAPWGEVVNGVRVRLRASRTAWSATDVPTFTIDLTSEKERPLPYGPVHDEFQLQFDGTWYRHVGPDIRSLAPSPATRREGIHLALSPRAWRQTPGGPLLDLVPGRHTVRVAFLVADGGGEGREPARAVSNAVEIDIVPAEARLKAPDQEPAWGEQVENLQCRIRAEKAAWTAGTVPKLFGDLRVYDMSFPALATASENWEIEIDGKWHKK